MFDTPSFYNLEEINNIKYKGLYVCNVVVYTLLSLFINLLSLQSKIFRNNVLIWMINILDGIHSIINGYNVYI